MKFGFSIFSVILILLQGLCTITINAQKTNDISELAQGVNSFSLDLLSHQNITSSSNKNLALSPYNVWTTLVIISEGANGETKNELNRVLHYDERSRKSYARIKNSTQDKTPGVDIETTNVVFIDSDVNLNPSYHNIVKMFFQTSLERINFKNLAQATRRVNSVIAEKTHNKIEHFAQEDDLKSVILTVISIMDFKGSWKIPFNDSATRLQNFMDYRGNVIGSVQLMYQLGTFPFAILPELSSNAVELPYGTDEPWRMSMIVILPKLHVSVEDVMMNLTKIGMEYVINTLDTAAKDYEDEDVQVYLPRFKINSDLSLDGVLFDLGITHVFDDRFANLSNIVVEKELHLTRVMHKAIIDVNEKGTEASAATGGFFQYKSPPPKFQADRPFLYFIVDKKINMIVFCGKYISPEN